MADKKFKTKEEYFKEYEHDEVEAGIRQILVSDFPKAGRRWRIIHDSFNASIEESYFWMLNYIRWDMGIVDVEKITDIFAASEHSAFFGVAQQRIGLQQDKVSQFLATIGKMVKELFQLVRELRILDERLGYYEKSRSEIRKTAEPAEITLKGIYIDMAEGGAKSPASVYGMARDLQFTTLPDLFFSTHPKDADDVGNVVDRLEFNKPVKNVLKRKLYSYLQWKKETNKELKNRRTFTLKYLRQHFDIIKMYMNWVRPYLRNIQRLQTDQRKAETPDLVSAFEGSMVEIEFLGKFLPEGNSECYAIMHIHFDYRTRPQMNYMQEGYQRGPLHIGQVNMHMRTYAWTEEDIEAYKQMRHMEDMELLSVVDASVKAAMEALGDELEKYLIEAGDKPWDKPEAEKKEEKRPGIFDPLMSVGKAFGSGVMTVVPAFGGGGKKKSNYQLSGEKSKAENDAVFKTWTTYKNYKKAHRMLAW
jgi:hypothetical protein